MDSVRSPSPKGPPLGGPLDSVRNPSPKGPPLGGTLAAVRHPSSKGGVLESIEKLGGGSFKVTLVKGHNGAERYLEHSNASYW